MDPSYIPYLGMFFGCLVAPGITFLFIHNILKSKREVEKLKYKKEILELEIRKEEIHLLAMKEENIKYDRIIDSKFIEENDSNNN